MVLTGLLYAIAGLVTHHFRKNLLPARSGSSWRVPQRPVLQRFAYLSVIFVPFPLTGWTGLGELRGGLEA